MTKRIARLITSKAGINLDLGCGPSKQPHFIGIDHRKLPGVDIVHDLEKFPWPLPDSCARHILLSHVWEHIKPWLTLRFMAEIHRVALHDAHVLIAAPYALGFRFCQDPTHCNPSNEATFLYWDDRHPLWQVYHPPVLHVIHYEVVPAGGDRDFNAVLQVCKPGRKHQCPHPQALPLGAIS